MNPQPQILCIGAMLWDVIGHTDRRISRGADVPGRIRHLPGGVALNIAIALVRWGFVPAVLSVVGQDPEGDALITAAKRLGVVTNWVTRAVELATDCYMAIEDEDGLVAATANVHSLEAAGSGMLAPLSGDLSQWRGPVVLDGNLTTEQLTRIATNANLADTDLRIVSASPGKVERLAPLLTARRGCFYLNRQEAEILAGYDFADASRAAAAIVRLGAARVLVTDGPHPVAECATGGPLLSHAPPSVAVNRVTGAGDSFVAAHLAAELKGLPRETALRQAIAIAAAHVSGKETP